MIQVMWASLLVLAQSDPAALVERLGSDDIEDRERAEAALARLGGAAEAALDSASRHADPEVAARAGRLLHEVVAPHRRDVNAALRHLVFHLRSELGRRNSVAGELAALLKRSFPFHPLARWENLATDAAVPELTKAEKGASFPYPDRKEWARVRESLRDSLAAIVPAGERCALCVRLRLESFRVGLKVENARARDVVDQLACLGDLRILVEVGDDAFDRAVTIDTQGMSLGDALDRTLTPFGLCFIVGEGGVVMVVPRQAE